MHKHKHKHKFFFFFSLLLEFVENWSTHHYWVGVDHWGVLGSESMNQLTCDHKVTGKLHRLKLFECSNMFASFGEAAVVWRIWERVRFNDLKGVRWIFKNRHGRIRIQKQKRRRHHHIPKP